MKSSYLVVFLALVLLASFSWADVEAPVKFEAADLGDLGDFHGEGPPKGQEFWAFWGGREPVVTPEWVVFPVKGKYAFIIDAKSHQFDKKNDTKNGVFAEVDLRARVHGLNGVKKIAKSKADQEKGELLVLHTRLKADADVEDEWFTDELEAGHVDPKNKVNIDDDHKTGIINFKQGMKVQLAIWFTNDEWDPDQKPAWDRNISLRSFEVLLPEGARSVDIHNKLATRWGKIKQSQ